MAGRLSTTLSQITNIQALFILSTVVFKVTILAVHAAAFVTLSKTFSEDHKL